MGLRAPQGDVNVKSRVYAVRSGRYNHQAWIRDMTLLRPYSVAAGILLGLISVVWCAALAGTAADVGDDLRINRIHIESQEFRKSVY